MSGAIVIPEIDGTNVFPDIEPSDYSWEASPVATVLDLANRSRQVNETSPRLQRLFNLRYTMEDDGVVWEELFPHFEAQRSTIFPFFDFWSIPWATPIPFATGDGETTTFVVPAAATEGLAVLVDGLPRAFTLLAAEGADGEDVIVFAGGSTPSPGAVISWSAAYARRRFPVWYYGGANTPPTFKPLPIEGGHWALDVQLIEDINA